MKQIKLTLQLNENVFNEYFKNCLYNSNENEKFAWALISQHIENMMIEYNEEDE